MVARVHQAGQWGRGGSERGFQRQGNSKQSTLRSSFVAYTGPKKSLSWDAGAGCGTGSPHLTVTCMKRAPRTPGLLGTFRRAGTI